MGEGSESEKANPDVFRRTPVTSGGWSCRAVEQKKAKKGAAQEFHVR